MAIYFSDISIISRGKGQSAIAHSAYISAERLKSEYDNRTRDYTRKHNEILFKDIIIPQGMNLPKLKNRAKLWSSVENYEKRVDSQLAREFEFALPNELSRNDQIAIVKDFCAKLTAHGLICDCAIHVKENGNQKNVHAHIMTTLRAIQPNGEWSEKKDRSLNSKDQLKQWRKDIADSTNKYLLKRGYEPITHESYAARGIKKIGQIHMGAAATALERRGIRTRKGDIYRDIAEQNEINEKLTELQERKEQLENEFADSLIQQTKERITNDSRESRTADRIERETTGENRDPRAGERDMGAGERKAELDRARTANRTARENERKYAEIERQSIRARNERDTRKQRPVRPSETSRVHERRIRERERESDLGW